MKRSPMRRMSLNKAKLNRIYAKREKGFIEENPLCAIRSPVCTGKTQCRHHAKGRDGIRLIEEKWHVPSCYPCNIYIKNNYKWGADRGFNLDRIGINND